MFYSLFTNSKLISGLKPIERSWTYNPGLKAGLTKKIKQWALAQNEKFNKIKSNGTKDLNCR